jgi:hypothetical protein
VALNPLTPLKTPPRNPASRASSVNSTAEANANCCAAMAATNRPLVQGLLGRVSGSIWVLLTTFENLCLSLFFYLS